MTDKDKTFETPLLFIIFSRPDTTRIVFEEIRKLRPRFLFVAADGPRLNNPGDAVNCQKVRDIIKEIDWPCELKTLFREKNLGCKIGASQAVSWFFDQVDAGIIVEDDVLPNQSFFYFCQELLLKYKDDEKIMHISGNNIFPNHYKNSYYFSNIPQMWGWASWRRAWQNYNLTMKEWPDFKKSGLLDTRLKNKAAKFVIEDLLEQYYRGKNSWDGQWLFSILKNDGICINSSVNLISNLGFDGRATHTKETGSKFSKQHIQELGFPLTHPDNIVIDQLVDRFILKEQFGVNKNIHQQIKSFFKINFTTLYMILKKVFNPKKIGGRLV